MLRDGVIRQRREEAGGAGGGPHVGLPKNISLLYGVSQFNVSLIKLKVRG